MSVDGMKNRMDDKTLQILEERARILAHPIAEEKASVGVLSLVTFHLGDEWYGVEIDKVLEVQPLDGQIWTRVPCTPDFIIGAVNLRGRIHSLMDVGSFLGLAPRPPTESMHILLVRSSPQDGAEPMELSIVTDDVPEVMDVPLTEIQTPTVTVSSQLREYTRGVTGRMLIVMDLNRLLSTPRIIVQEETV